MSQPSAALSLSGLQRLCTSEQMRRWDANAIDNLGKPGRLLMENAASAAKKTIVALMKLEPRQGPVVVCCGQGNNGGDGFAVARLVRNHGLEVTVVMLGEPAGQDAMDNLDSWRGLGETLLYEGPGGAASACLERAVLIVDALFGTGLNRPVEGIAAQLIAEINAAPAALKVALDVPSGINADTGAVLGEAVRCSHTLSFQVGKVGCFQFPGVAHAGQVIIEDIGIPVDWSSEDPGTYQPNDAFVRLLLPHRARDSHKGSFGHLLAICGSAGMGGAALLAGLAGLKTGAGLITVGVPRTLRNAFIATAPELMTLSTEQGDGLAFREEDAAFFLEAAQSRSAVVLGCGLGQAAGTQAFVRRLATGISQPMLIDADALNAMDGAALIAREHPTVITPHPGELARLSGLTIATLGEERVAHARRLSMEWGVVLVLKGAATVVADPGGEVFINPTGDQGLATAGSGDVLSGIIGSLLAQGLAPLPAAMLGVYLHGLARDCQREQITTPYFSALDLISGINLAFGRLDGD